MTYCDVIETEGSEYAITPHPMDLMRGLKGKQLLDVDWYVMTYSDGSAIYAGSRDACIKYCQENNLKFDAAGIEDPEEKK